MTQDWREIASEYGLLVGMPILEESIKAMAEEILKLREHKRLLWEENCQVVSIKDQLGDERAKVAELEQKLKEYETRSAE